ncbi:FAD-linked oxidase C-terminal domain-containing protein [Microbacterium barkeri]|nr:FAD-linked oxidase C-terminal domain-containing protein [Microbacterium barkeri]MDI6944271.1 FAD-linked oxidase C-terminal domain-containing protein [Microbacterium barkeri]
MILDELVARLHPTQTLTGDATESYTRDASPAVPEMPLAVVLAESTQDVSTTLEWASTHRVPVIPRGAGSGVSGGATATKGSVIVSLERMKAIRELRPADRLAVVEPGVIIDTLDAAAREQGLMFAPDPASSAWATVGGAIATNAGGFHCLRHGVTADSVRALTVVLADGRVLRTGARSRKNVAGYDLTHLFVGSEGTLGIVTEATVKLEPIPRGQTRTFLVAFPSLMQAGSAVSELMASSITPDLLELLNRTTANLVEDFEPGHLDRGAAATLIGQVTDLDADAQIHQLRTLFARHGGEHFEVRKGDALIEVRKRVQPALAARGMGVAWMSSDAAVPPSRLSELLRHIEQLQIEDGRDISVVAHAGDGNIHAAVAGGAGGADDLAAAKRIVRAIAERAVQLGGTVTGEHGIGSLKRDFLALQFDETALEVQAHIKAALDPAGILNPGRAV